MINLDTVQRYLNKHAEAFINVLEAIKHENPDQIVAIARKGPRLLELCGAYFGTDLVDFSKVISDRAIPFLSKDALQNGHVVLFGDIVIYGSTFRDVTNTLLSKDVLVKPYTIAINEEQINPCIADPIHAIGLTNQETACYSTIIVSAFGILAKPYDLDFPILHVNFDGDDPKSVIRRLQNWGITSDLSTPIQKQASVLNASIQIPGESIITSAISDHVPVTFDGARKVRIYFDFRSKVVKVVPIYLFTLNQSNSIEWGKFFVKDLQCLNEILMRGTEEVKRNEQDEETVKKVGLMLATYLVAYLYGVEFLAKCKHVFATSEIDKARNILSRFDLRLLFGDRFSKYLIDYFNEHQTELLNFVHQVSTRQSGQLTLPLLQEEQKSEQQLTVLDQELLNHIKSKLPESLSPDWGLETNINSLFKRIYFDYDLPQRRAGTVVQGRLSRGFTYSEVMGILRENNIEVDNSEFSQAIDYLIDTGAIIPLYKVFPNGVSTRLYRFGEAIFNPDAFKYFVATCAQHLQHLCKISGHTKEDVIPATLFEKVFAYVVEEQLKKGSKFNPPEIFSVNLGFDLYGRRVQVREGNRVQDFPEWCATHRIIMRRQGRGEPIRLNPAFYELYPANSDPRVAEEIKESESIVTLLMDILVETKYAYAPIALTTCNSQRNFRDAIRAELDLWFDDQEVFYLCAELQKRLQREGWPDETATETVSNYVEKMRARDEQGASNLLDKASSQVKQLAVDLNRLDLLLQRLANFPAQTAQKKKIFDYTPKLNEKLNKLYNSDNFSKAAHRHIWEKYFEGRLDTTVNPNLSIEINRHLALGELTRTLTSLCRTFLSDTKLLPPHPEGQTAQFYTDKYRRIAAEIASSDRAFNLTTMPSTAIYESPDLPNRFAAFVESVRGMRNELDRHYQTFIVPRRTPELRVLSEGKCVLKYDIIGSTDIIDKEKRNQMVVKINPEMEHYIRNILKDPCPIRPIGDDANAYIFTSALNALKTSEWLDEIVRRYGKHVRVGIATTGESEPLKYAEDDTHYDTLTSSAFAIAARIGNLWKDTPKETGRESVIFLTEAAKDEVLAHGQGHYKDEDFENLGIQNQLKGKSIEPVHVFRYRIPFYYATQ